jgi:hypothetical protein
MRTTRSLALAALAALALTIAPLAPAHAAAGPPVSQRPCTVVTWAPGDPVPGGELVAFSAHVAAPGATTVSVRCSLHADNATHDGSAVAEATGGPAPHAAAIPLAVSTHPYDEWAVEYLCGQATVDGTTWYWSGSAWTTGAGSSCGPLADTAQCLAYLDCVPWDDLPPALDPVLRTIGCWWWGWENCTDYTTCGYLALLAPGLPGGVVDIRPDGDVYLAGGWIWDCPPYGPIE